MRERRRFADLTQLQRLVALERRATEAALSQSLREERDRLLEKQDADQRVQECFDQWNAQLSANPDPYLLAGLPLASRARQGELEAAAHRHAEAENATDARRGVFGAAAGKLKLLDEKLSRSRRRLSRQREEKTAHELADRVAHAWRAP